MIKDESKILRYFDWAFYLIFVPAILLLIPTDKIMDRYPGFFGVMMAYMLVVHVVNSRFNFLTYIFRRRYNRAAVAICVVALITYITSVITISKVDEIDNMLSNQSGIDFNVMRYKVLFTLLFIDICFTVMIALLIELFRQKIQRQSVEAEKSKAELAIYKSQINPHFMFNTLNTIYALNFTGSSKTGEVIMKFSNIVKYIYQNNDKDMIMISEEVEYLREFIDLHTMRISEQTVVNFSSEVDDDSCYIPSMIFITFVENVFKYGVSSSADSTIDIAIRLEDSKLVFTTSNTIFSRRGDSSGIGIENCRKRLSLLYPNRYILNSGAKGDIYRTMLKIEL